MADLNIGNSSSSVVVNAKHNGAVIPQINNTYDLGTSDLRWKNIYSSLKGNADTATTATNLASSGTWTWTNGSTAGPTASLVLGGKTTSIGAIPSASGSASGVITTGAQTIVGEKTFNNTLNFASINNVAFNFRPGGTGYDTTMSYQTSGNEALVFATKNAVTSFMFVNGEDSVTNHGSDRWRYLTPTLQMKNKSVYINSLINHNVTPSYNLYVNGTTYLNGKTYINTNSGTSPFYITRSGGEPESVAMSVDDSTYTITYTNDEAGSQIRFRLINTDTEDGTQDNTTDSNIYLNSSYNFYPGVNNVGGIGTSANKWANMYATTFHGALDGNAATATKLATARTIRTNLASTSTASFDGSANITPGVTGTLPIANGGTGATTASTARDNLGAQSKVLYGSSAPSDSTGSNGDMYIALESGDFKKDIVDLIYPVGSIYISTNSTNPSTLFGGTWEAFGQGRVLIGAGTGNDGSTSLSFTAGGTGGEYKHTLSVSEMPSHTHKQNAHTHTVGAHSHGLNSHTHSYTKATGVAGHTLTTAEMPSHYHTFGTADRQNSIVTGWKDYGLTMRTGSSYDITKGTSSAGGGGSHNHGLNTTTANTGAASGSTANSSAFNSGSTTATNQNTGGGSSHNNIQPYIVVYMWKRTA